MLAFDIHVILTNLADNGGGSRIKKASSDKGLDEAETSERTKGGGGDSETVAGVVNGRPNRMSYPAGAAKGPLRKKRSSSRLAGKGDFTVCERIRGEPRLT